MEMRNLKSSKILHDEWGANFRPLKARLFLHHETWKSSERDKSNDDTKTKFNQKHYLDVERERESNKWKIIVVQLLKMTEN